MATFQLTIASVHETHFEGLATSLTAPGVAGELTVLAHHIPLVTTLRPGELLVRTSEGEERFAVDHGILEVSGGATTVLL